MTHNDDWEKKYRRYYGTPLTKLQDRWDMSLDRAEPHGDAIEEPITKDSLSPRAQMVSFLAKQYVKSNPGPSNAAPNTAIIGGINEFFRGSPILSEGNFSFLYDTITFRLGQFYEVDYLRMQMGIDFPSIFDIVVHEWKKNNWGTSGDKYLAKKQRWNRAYTLIDDMDLHTSPEGWKWYAHNARDYLATAIAEIDAPWEEIEKRAQQAYYDKLRFYCMTYKAVRELGALWQIDPVSYNHEQ